MELQGHFEVAHFGVARCKRGDQLVAVHYEIDAQRAVIDVHEAARLVAGIII